MLTTHNVEWVTTAILPLASAKLRNLQRDDNLNLGFVSPHQSFVTEVTSENYV